MLLIILGLIRGHSSMNIEQNVRKTIISGRVGGKFCWRSERGLPAYIHAVPVAELQGLHEQRYKHIFRNVWLFSAADSAPLFFRRNSLEAFLNTHSLSLSTEYPDWSRLLMTPNFQTIFLGSSEERGVRNCHLYEGSTVIPTKVQRHPNESSNISPMKVQPSSKRRRAVILMKVQPSWLNA